jgi:hypothetical protein
MFEISRARKSEISAMFGTAKYVGPPLGTYSSQNEMIYDKLAHMPQAKRIISPFKPTLSVSQSFLRVCMSSLVTACSSATQNLVSLRGLVSYIAHRNL